MEILPPKASLLLVWLVVAVCTVLTKAEEEFYSCPTFDPSTVGLCEEECSSHSDCPNETRCCSNGCGHVCTMPISIPYHQPTLVCPESPEGGDIAGICSEECDDCDEGEMCCSNGCGHACIAGVFPSPLCTSLRDTLMNSSMIGAYIPQCNEETGGFSAVQCHGSTAYCWCVEEESGRPVTDVTRFTMPQCNCTYNDQLFKAGDTFPAEGEDDDADCNVCSCTTDGGVSCTNSVCEGVEMEEEGEEMEVAFLSCPAVRIGTSADCGADCLLHSECSSSLKCCYNGCGYSCMTAHTIPYVDISSSYITECPAPSDMPCADVVGSCREEGAGFECQAGEMCCDTNCGSAMCMSTLLESPCVVAVAVSSAANSTQVTVEGYKPQCTAQGDFRQIQCHAHYCWCVNPDSGVPLSDIVAFQQAGELACAECVYNGIKYGHLESFPSGDGCNTCSCIGGTISCSGVECYSNIYGDDDDDVWEWWHSVLIGCVVVVVVLVTVVLALLMGIVILMRHGTQHRHHRLKEETLTSEECDMVEYRNGHESVELKVPVEDQDHATLPISGELEVKV